MCFEILGFDIMFDDKMTPILIDLNHSPSFNTDTPLDTKIKKTVLEDTINIL
jgi:tubulin polyglutamylase TTLL6/13